MRDFAVCRGLMSFLQWLTRLSILPEKVPQFGRGWVMMRKTAVQVEGAAAETVGDAGDIDMSGLQIDWRPSDALVSYARNARTHSAG